MLFKYELLFHISDLPLSTLLYCSQCFFGAHLTWLHILGLYVLLVLKPKAFQEATPKTIQF